MKKRLFICLFAACLLFTALAPMARAEEETADTTEAETLPERAEDECGDNLKWTIEGSTLFILGSGAMDDYESSYDAPWFAYRDGITAIEITGTATTIGTYAFENYDNLTSIDFGGSLTEIGEGAFRNCDGLTSISLPATFRRFGPSCFEGCANLTEVWCAGSMPSFRFNCLWNGRNVTVYCPADKLWGAQYVEELETNFGGRLQVLADDGTDPYDFDTEETTVPTTKPAETEPEETTEATTQPTTQPTEAATEAVTEETTQATEETTAEPTEEETVQEPASAENNVRSSGGKILIGILAVVGILSLALAAVMIFRASAGRGGRYEE